MSSVCVERRPTLKQQTDRLATSKSSLGASETMALSNAQNLTMQKMATTRMRATTTNLSRRPLSFPISRWRIGTEKGRATSEPNWGRRRRLVPLPWLSPSSSALPPNRITRIRLPNAPPQREYGRHFSWSSPMSGSRERFGVGNTSRLALFQQTTRAFFITGSTKPPSG